MKKEQYQAYAIIGVLFVLIATISYLVYKSINHEKKTYEGAKNGEIFETTKCVVKNGVCYCEKDGLMIKVDNFYERS